MLDRVRGHGRAGNRDHACAYAIVQDLPASGHVRWSTGGPPTAALIRDEAGQNQTRGATAEAI